METNTSNLQGSKRKRSNLANEAERDTKDANEPRAQASKLIDQADEDEGDWEDNDEEGTTTENVTEVEKHMNIPLKSAKRVKSAKSERRVVDDKESKATGDKESKATGDKESKATGARKKDDSRGYVNITTRRRHQQHSKKQLEESGDLFDDEPDLIESIPHPEIEGIMLGGFSDDEIPSELAGEIMDEEDPEWDVIPDHLRDLIVVEDIFAEDVIPEHLRGVIIEEDVVPKKGKGKAMEK